MNNRNGILLIVMVGILTLLLILSVFFSTLAKMEKTRTTSGTDHVRARLLARAGVEYAVSRLLESGNASILSASSDPEDDWRYRDDPSIPLEQSYNPSFNHDPYIDADSNGRFNEGDGYSDPDRNNRYDGFSGRLRGTHASHSDRFKLRIEDPSGKIAVNGALSGSLERWEEEPLLVDHNENGVWDPSEPYTDRHKNNRFDGPPDEFVDWNENGMWDSFSFHDLNGNGQYDPESDVVSDNQSARQRQAGDKESQYRWSSGSRGYRPLGAATYDFWEPYMEADGTALNDRYFYGEPFSDLNENGMWDPADEFDDLNGNGVWDGPLPPEWISMSEGLIQSLGEILGMDDLGGRIRENWPYPDKKGLADALGTDAAKVLPFLTLWGRADKKVVRPHASSIKTDGLVSFQAELNRLGPLVFEERVPVTVNTASQEVVQAVLHPLSARFLTRQCRDIHHGERVEHSIGSIQSVSMRPTAAQTLAEEIVRESKEGEDFSSWRQWEGWLRSRTGPVLTEEEEALVNANCNPNSRLNKFNPDSVLDRLIDKSDLTVWTTEWNFDPPGIFEIASLGEVREAFVSWRVGAVVSLWEVWKDTSQWDFGRGSVSGNSDPVLAPSYRSRSMQIYPEPETEHHGAAGWDGHILLSTNRSETVPGDETAVEGDALSSLPGWEQEERVPLFYARFEGGLSGSYSREGGNLACYPETEDWHPGWDQPNGRPNENSILHPENPGSLYPDGVYSDWRNVPAYEFEKNFESEAGAVSFWMKFGGTDIFWPGRHVTCSFTYDPGLSDHISDGGTSHWLAVGWTIHNHPQFGMISEPTGIDDSENTPHYRFILPEKGRWIHVGAAWDQTQALAKKAALFQANDRIPAIINSYGVLNDGRTVTNFKYEEDDGENRSRFRLGEINRPTDQAYYDITYSACSTLDEFCIYGRQGAVADETQVSGNPQLWASEHTSKVKLIFDERYAHGRYYNLGDASFTSASRRFHAGTHFLKMRWTSLIPERKNLSESEEDALKTVEETPQAGGWWGGVSLSEMTTDPRWRILLDFFDGEKWMLDLDNDGKLSPVEEAYARNRGLDDEGGIPIARDVASKTRGAAQHALTDSGPIVPPDGMIRYRAYFLEDANWLTTPLLESPVLDDVTITYVPPGGPKTIRYSEGE